jgi:hypothetical protein
MAVQVNTIGQSGIQLPKADFRAVPARGGAKVHLARYGQSWDSEPHKFVAIKKAFQLLEDSGALAKIDQMCFFALDENDSLLNWIVAGTAPINQGMVFGPLGFEGDAASAYIDTGFNPSTAISPKYGLNGAHVGVFISDNVGAQGASNIAMGQISGSTRTLIYPMSTASNTAYRINGSATISFSGNPYHGQPGLLLVNRFGATGTRMTHNGEVVHQETGTDPATSVPNGNLAIGRHTTSYGGGKYAGWLYGGTLSVGAGQEAAVVQAFTRLARAHLP